MTNLYYFNKFQDKLELVAENIEDVNEDCSNCIIDFYYDTSMNVFYGNIEQVVGDNDTTGWPDDVEKVYYVEVESKEISHFIFLITTTSYAEYYNSFSMASSTSTSTSTVKPTYDWEC